MGINAAMPNHPKKQKKKVIHVIWKVRICMPFPEKIFNFCNGCSVEVVMGK
jgi:hypothetical protein